MLQSETTTAAGPISRRHQQRRWSPRSLKNASSFSWHSWLYALNRLEQLVISNQSIIFTISSMNLALEWQQIWSRSRNWTAEADEIGRAPARNNITADSFEYAEESGSSVKEPHCCAITDFFSNLGIFFQSSQRAGSYQELQCSPVFAPEFLGVERIIQAWIIRWQSHCSTQTYPNSVAMVVYNIYIFDNHGTFLFYSEYKRAKKADMSYSEVSNN